MNFKVVPISAPIAQQARATMLSPQYKSLPAFSAVANGYGPCRSCLKTFNEGSEHRTFFTYDPNEGISKLPQPGPIFIHTDACEEFSGDGFPSGIRDLPMLFEGFDDQCEMVVRVAGDAERLESQIDSVFAEPRVEFIKIRNAAAGCFIARIDKA